MTHARYNIFQSLVRQWERLHPYNGVQVIRVRRALPATESLSAGWDNVQRRLGIGSVIENRRTYSLGASPASSIDQIGGVAELEPHLTALLNKQYSPGEPFLSPFVLSDGPDAFWMGLGYRHWLADSVAIRRILGAWLRAVLNLPDNNELLPPLHLPTHGYWSLFGSGDFGGPLRWSLTQAVLESARQSSRMKRVQRVKSNSVTDHRVEFSLHPQPDGTLARLLRYARSRNAKVNDVLLAILGLAVAEHGPLARTPIRQDLALGTIVDLRPLAPPQLSLENTLGLYLGFTTTFLRPAHLSSLDDALRTIASQQDLARRRLSAASSMIRIYIGNIAHRVYPSAANIASFYRKRIPLSAGISNVNLATDPLSAFHPDPITHFIRVSPTGPMMPLVISATSLGDTFHFGLTRRLSAVPNLMATQIASRISGLLASL
jgi:hypothetical protein